MEPENFKSLLENIDETPELLAVLKEYVHSNVKLVDNSEYDYYGGHTTIINVEFKGERIDTYYDSSAARTCWD